MKILSIHDLATIRKRAEHNLSLREESNEKVTEKCYGLASGAQHLQILICGGTGCKASSSQGITDNLLKAIQKNEITDKVEVITVGCFGFCEKGPIVKIIPDNTFYTQVTPEDAEEIINEHIIGGRRIERLLYIDPKTEQTVSDSKHMDFYRKQLRVALRNCGFIDSENIEEYIAREGYFALADCLLCKQPADVIDVIKRSGLRGRGGGGFPTGLKWEFAGKQVSNVKYVVCNADEGDPGAFMDRSIMEGDPHSIVEAMCICGYSMMNKGFEVIEAKWLFGVRPDQIEVVVHPQSVIHSMVQFEDGAVKAQLGMPDMRLPIQYAFSYPDRLKASFPRLDFKLCTELTFEQPDITRFRNLALAYEALHRAGNMPCIVNAANEVVVAAFLQDKISFLGMSEVIEKTMSRVSYLQKPTYEDYVATDAEARRIAEELI